MDELRDFIGKIPQNLDAHLAYLKSIKDSVDSAIESIKKFQSKADGLKQTTQIELTGLIKTVEQKKIETQALDDAQKQIVSHARSVVGNLEETAISRKAEVKKLDLVVAGISSVVKILTSEKSTLLQKLGRIKDEMHKTISKK